MNLQITGLTKTYPNRVQALKNISLSLEKGMFGLLGPNGSGKSSLMRTIATLQEADEGEIVLNGINVLTEKNKIRQILGYLPQEFGVYPKISAEEMLNHIAQLKGIINNSQRKEIVASLLDKVNLTSYKNKKLGTFSGGMKQRFGIAQALIGNPSLIIVDEPTAGLDPGERNRFYNLLSQIGENTIVILSTHIVEDVSTLCSKFAIIYKGEILHSGNPEQSIQEIEGKIYIKSITQIEYSHHKEHYNVLSSQLKAGKLYVRIIHDSFPGDGFMQTTANLEDVYFNSIFSRTNMLPI